MVQITGEILVILNDIANMAIERFPEYKEEDRAAILNKLERHYVTGTIDWIYSKEGLKAVVLYDIINDGRVANILDLFIQPGENGVKIIIFFVARGWARFPSLQFVRFERVFNDKEGHRMYRIERFLNKGVK